LDDIYIRPGASVLYLGAASGTSVSHVADIVGPTGRVYAVEFSHRSGRDLITMATHRTNVIPIIEDARHPLRYRMLVGMVDVVFADVAQPDQARIVGLNAHLFLKVGGGVVVSVKANCIDSTAKPEVVFANEVKKMREERIKPKEQLTLGEFPCCLSSCGTCPRYSPFPHRDCASRLDPRTAKNASGISLSASCVTYSDFHSPLQSLSSVITASSRAFTSTALSERTTQTLPRGSKSRETRLSTRHETRGSWVIYSHIPLTGGIERYSCFRVSAA
jgi:hypothetical protein